MDEDIPLVAAATVLLLRDGDDGLEVLMVRRNSKIAFGGMWVFPGGRVDDAELDRSDELGSARRAAVRETEEETGLITTEADMASWSYWEPPPSPAMQQKGPIRRFSTWFFAAPAPPGDVVIDDGEITEHAWLTPGSAHDRHRRGEIELVPPTWLTLLQLGSYASVSDAMTWAHQSEPRRFRTRPVAKRPLTLAWEGDHEHPDTALDRSAAVTLHRLVMHDEGWRYHLS